jgi:hypothetical protein
MTSGLRQRSRTSRKNPILRARVNSLGPYSSMRRAASSDVRPSTVEPSRSSASVVGSWQISFRRPRLVSWVTGRVPVNVSPGLPFGSQDAGRAQADQSLARPWTRPKQRSGARHYRGRLAGLAKGKGVREPSPLRAVTVNAVSAAGGEGQRVLPDHRQSAHGRSLLLGG